MNNDEKMEYIVSKIKSALDMWLAFLTRHDLLKVDNLPQELNNESLKKALNVMEVMNFNEAEKNAYEERLKWFMIESNTLKKAKEKGMAEGLEKGIEKGLAEGIEIGREENMKNTALKMLKRHVDMQFIAEITGLSVEELKKLKISSGY